MKEYWIVSSNSNKFRLDDLLRNNNVVDWKQGQYKFKTGDIVYIYSTLPKGRITYEMEVVKDKSMKLIEKQLYKWQKRI